MNADSAWIQIFEKSRLKERKNATLKGDNYNHYLNFLFHIIR